MLQERVVCCVSGPESHVNADTNDLFFVLSASSWQTTMQIPRKALPVKKDFSRLSDVAPPTAAFRMQTKSISMDTAVRMWRFASTFRLGKV